MHIEVATMLILWHVKTLDRRVLNMKILDFFFANKKLSTRTLGQSGVVFVSEQLITKKDEKEILLLAYNFFENKKFDKSIETFKLLSEVYPNNKGYYLSQMGLSYYFLDDYVKAIEIYNNALKHGADTQMIDDNIWEATEALYEESKDKSFIERYVLTFPEGKYRKRAVRLLNK